MIYVGHGVLALSGKGKLLVTVDGFDGKKGRYSDAKDGKGTLGYIIKLSDAKVEIIIPQIGMFKGTVTGVPLK